MLNKYQHDMMRLYYSLLLFLAAAGDGIHGCLTWELGGHSIRFVCIIENNSRTVHLVDNHEQTVARCTFNGSSGICSPLKFVKAIIQENLVTFDIDLNLKKDVNGNWTCLQKDQKFMSEVSTSRDLADMTIVNLFGKIIEDNDVQKLLLRCSSCRIPKGKNIEFLLNNSSVDSITFNNETGKCTHLHGDCISSTCQCSPTGNTYDRIFLLERSFDTATYISCKMRFEDKLRSEIFSKVTTVHFNGKEFTDKGTRTVRTKLSDDHNNPKDKDGDTVEVLVAVIGAITVVAIILFVGIWSHRKGRNLVKKKNIHTEEAFPLMEIKDHIDQSNREELIMPHGKNLQCKPFGKESPTRRDTTVMTAHINIDEEICGEDSTLLFKDHPHYDVKGGSISRNDTTVMTAHIDIDEEICGEDSTLLFKDHPHSDVKGGSISRNETNNQIVQLNYLKYNPSPFKNAQEVKRNPKSDKETDSIFLFRVLDFIGANHNYRRICHRACITSEIISTFLGVCTQYAIGDAWEGTVTPGTKSDYDAIICQEDFAVIDDISKAHENEVSLIVVRESDTPAGYVKLQLLDRSKPYENTNRPAFDNEFTSLLQKDKFESTFLTNNIKKGTEGLPFTSRPLIWSAATLLNQCYGKVNAVWCFRCKEWPKEAQEWLSRSRCYGWPTPNTINELKSFGHFFLKKGHPHSLEKHLEWKIYFPLQERKLVFNLTDIQYKSYVVLKMINRDILNLECLTTYHWKTCLFYVIEENKHDNWGENHVIHCVRLCIRQMLKWIKCGFCPNYFIPKENLFEGQLDGKLRIISENRLLRILDDRFCCVFHVKSSNICDMLDARDSRLPNNCAHLYWKYIEFERGMRTLPYLFAHHAFNHYQANNQNTKVITLWRLLFHTQNANTISEHTQIETRRSLFLLTPLIYTSLASNISALCIRQPNLQSRDFLLLGSCIYFKKGGLNGFLKFISVLYSVGCYKECKWFIDLLDETYMKSLPSICVCHVFPRVVYQMEKNIIDIEVSNLCPCISFLPTELLITPDALKYEMFKNCGMSMAVVDSKVFYFFLKFLIKTKLYGDLFSKHDMHEIDQIKDLLSRFNVRHRDVAYNLLAWCLCTVGMTSLALDNIRMSWIEIQTSDFSVSHFYSAKLHAAVSLYKYFVTRMSSTYPNSVPF